METVGRPARLGGHKETSGFLLARMKAVPSGQFPSIKDRC